METRITKITVVDEGKELFDESATTIEIVDQAAGEYVKVQQCHAGTEDGTITICPNEWPAIRDAIEKMITQCRSQ
jgi:hypothetical protein